MLAVFLFFLFPGTFLHVLARERAYHIWLSELRAYEELIQKQGYITASMMEQLGNSKGGLFGELEVEIWRWEEREEGENKKGESKEEENEEGTNEEETNEERENESQAILDIEKIWYLEEWVYPLHTGDILGVRIKMPFDFLEKLYYTFCPPASAERYRVEYVMIRDGILERISEEQVGQ